MRLVGQSKDPPLPDNSSKGRRIRLRESFYCAEILGFATLRPGGRLLGSRRSAYGIGVSHLFGKGRCAYREMARNYSLHSLDLPPIFLPTSMEECRLFS